MPGPRAIHIPLSTPIDLLLTLAPLAHGRGDPTIRFAADGIWRASRTPEGAATLRLHAVEGGVSAEAWGPGATWALERAAALVGAEDDPSGLVAHHRLVADLVRRFPGLRLPRSDRAFEALLPAICEQKVTGWRLAQPFAPSWRRTENQHRDPAE